MADQNITDAKYQNMKDNFSRAGYGALYAIGMGLVGIETMTWPEIARVFPWIVIGAAGVTGAFSVAKFIQAVTQYNQIQK